MANLIIPVPGVETDFWLLDNDCDICDVLTTKYGQEVAVYVLQHENLMLLKTDQVVSSSDIRPRGGTNHVVMSRFLNETRLKTRIVADMLSKYLDRVRGECRMFDADYALIQYFTVEKMPCRGSQTKATFASDISLYVE